MGLEVDGGTIVSGVRIAISEMEAMVKVGSAVGEIVRIVVLDEACGNPVLHQGNNESARERNERRKRQQDDCPANPLCGGRRRSWRSKGIHSREDTPNLSDEPVT